MEKDLLRLFQLADELNKKQNKVYAEITYYADNSKKLEISIRNKKDFSYVEKCEMQLKKGSLITCKDVVHLFEIYINGCDTNE